MFGRWLAMLPWHAEVVKHAQETGQAEQSVSAQGHVCLQHAVGIVVLGRPLR